MAGSLAISFSGQTLKNLGGHLKTGHRWTLQKRPTESGQDTSIYNLNVGI
jgi:hypothetical protein